MKRCRFLLGLILVMCFMSQVIPADADASLLPQTALWEEQKTPVEVLISLGSMKKFVPFDEKRTEDLARLLKHTHLRLSWKEEMEEVWYQTKLLVEDRETVSLNRRDYAGQSLIQLSSLPGITYSTMVPDPLGKLLGSSQVSSWGGLDLTMAQWLPQMEDFLSFIRTACTQWKSEKTARKKIRNAGMAAVQETYTIPGEDAEAFQQALSAFETPGPLAVLLKTLQFSGPQKIVTLISKEGEVLTFSYTGNCVPAEDDLRKVKLTWKLGRGDKTLMDDLSLDAPAVKGKNGLSADFSRQLTADKKQRKLTVKLVMETQTAAGKVKSSLATELAATPQNDTDLVTGKIELNTEQDSSKSILTLEPKLQVDQSSIPGGSGAVAVHYRKDGKTLADLSLMLTLEPAEAFPWEMNTETVDLDRMEESAASKEMVKISTAVAKAVLPHLILLPEEDTCYLSRGLTDEVWQTMVEAAKQEVP